MHQEVCLVLNVKKHLRNIISDLKSSRQTLQGWAWASLMPDNCDYPPCVLLWKVLSCYSNKKVTEFPLCRRKRRQHLENGAVQCGISACANSPCLLADLSFAYAFSFARPLTASREENLETNWNFDQGIEKCCCCSVVAWKSFPSWECIIIMGTHRTLWDRKCSVFILGVNFVCIFLIHIMYTFNEQTYFFVNGINLTDNELCFMLEIQKLHNIHDF